MALKPYFEKDGITLYHGDCLDLLPELPPESFDLAMTDPPYLVSYAGRWGNGHQPIKGDDDPNWVEPAFSEIYRLLVPDSFCLSFYGWPHADVFLSTWKGIGFRPVSLVVGVKHNWGFGHYTRSKQETAYLLAKGRPKKPAAAVADFYAWQRPSLPVHPNEKPLHAITGLMGAFSLKTSRVLDPFAGSGTTLVAARNLGIPAVGIEIYEHYCEVAAKRLSEDVFVRKAEPGQMRLF